MLGFINRKIVWLLVVLPLLTKSQNLVPNGSFETYSDCPYQDNLLKFATPWFNPNEATPDFYHRCINTGQMLVAPRTGNGLARLFMDFNWAEYISVPLNEPLQANECYYFEMYVAIEGPIRFLPQTLGAYFSETPFSFKNKLLFDVKPQVLDNQLNNQGPPLEWKQVWGYVLPKGGERYLTIGNFYQLPQFLGFYYLFLDDIKLTPFRLELGRDTTLCGRSSTLRLNANVPGATSYRWNDGSTSSTLLVTRPGKYWVTVSSACKEVSDTVKGNYQFGFDWGEDTTLCNGQTMVLASPPNANPRWQNGATTNTFRVSQPGKYTLTVSQSGCSVKDSLVVKYILPPKLTLGQDQTLCFGEAYTIRPSYAEGKFAWKDNYASFERPVFSDGMFAASVTNDCGVITDSLLVHYQACGCIVYAPDIFTPNEDGHNDVFEPLVGCPEVTITKLAIYNRWGELVFQTSTTPFRWEGKYNGEYCPSNSYVWKVDYTLNKRGVVSDERALGSLILVR
jgi:gliding motility-associated-like protein